MCFTVEMKNILPKENPDTYGKDLAWYVEDLLLAYKYNMKERYIKALNYIRKYSKDERLIRCFEGVADRSYSLK